LHVLSSMPPLMRNLIKSLAVPVLLLVLLGSLAGCQSPTQAETTEPTEADEPTQVADSTPEEEVEAAETQAREANRQLERDRQALQLAAWNQVKSITDMWSAVPPEYFPGISGLVRQIDELQAEIEQDGTIKVGMIDPIALTAKNPAFWRAALETNPEDPVVDLFEQMLWAARGNFDRALWLIEINRYGPALPENVHHVLYSIADEMRRVRSRQIQRRNRLIENLPPDQVAQVIATARSFRPDDPDWAMLAVLVRLGQSGVDLDNMTDAPEAVDRVMREMETDWRLIAVSNPMTGAQISPDPAVRAAARELTDMLGDLSESRGAFGGRDLERLSEAFAEVGFWSEALLAQQRAVALRGFTVPSDNMIWWDWLPNLIGEEATALIQADAESGKIWPVSFFPSEIAPEGVSLMPLHPILTDRNLRRLQEVQRQLAQPELMPDEKARAKITLAETLGHLGRWEEAREALDNIPTEYQPAGAPMRVWVSLWSGEVESIADEMAAVEPDMIALSPSLPALSLAAQGEWAQGAREFLRAADSEEISLEYRTYYTLMAAAFLRIAGDDDEADRTIEAARELGQGYDWVSTLVQGMAGEVGVTPVGDNITEITEAGRVCEQRFYRAFQRDIDPARQRAMLESCVATGVVDFVEYTASLIRLRQLDPERWDPRRYEQEEPAEEVESPAEDSDWTKDAEPSWSIPS